MNICVTEDCALIRKRSILNHVSTGIIFKTTATGIPKNPIIMLRNHCANVSGVVLANAPKYSTIMIWKKTVALRTDTKHSCPVCL